MAGRAVLSLRTLAAVPLVGTTIYAASETGSNKVKVKDLPIYEAPEHAKIIYMEEKMTPFRQYVSSARVVVWQYADSMKETTDKVKSGYAALKQYGNDSLASVREDTAVLQRAAIITVAGLGGIVAGYKGGALRKAIFAGTGMIATASIVYPRQAVDITSRNWDKVLGEAKDMWKEKTSGASSSTKEKPKDIKVEEAAPKKIEAVVDAPKDFGQSKPEDKDMYTTRS